jgi:sec-independent protein translocase protein TatC
MQSMPLLTHVDELFLRFRRCVLWLILGASVGYYFANDIYEGLRLPILEYLGAENPLVFTRFFEKVGVLMRISLVMGLLVASPMWGAEVIAFIKPALKAQERKHLKTLVVSFVLAFVLGSYFGYRWVLPTVIQAVFSFGHAELVPMLTVSSYVNAAIGIVLMSALFFEIPVLMINLSLWGWVKASTWAKGRRLSVVVNAVLSAFLSPPDPWSMIIMMIPLQVLFELGILLARLIESLELWKRGVLKERDESKS